MAAGTPGDVELDLDDDPGAPPPPRPRSASVPWSRAGWAAGGLVVGLVLGHAWLPGGAGEAPPPAPSPSPSGAPVRMALGAYAPTDREVVRIGRRISVAVPAVVVNETSAPLVVRDLQVSGPGAGLASGDFSFREVVLPLHLPPGEAVELPFRLTSDCTVRVRPLPRITLVVAPDDGSAGTPVDVRIPDLGSLWGRTLDPSLCLD